MKSCPECNFQNPDDIHICLRCAATLERVCPSCGEVVPNGNKFCGQCGTRVEQQTLAGNTMGQPAKTAPNLQEQLLNNLRQMMPNSLVHKINNSYSQELHGQRREVTILCVDIANIDDASAVIDSEDLYLAIDYIMQLLTNSVYKYEGTIDQFTGQGLTALFGIPLNHENDPERAVRAAIEMLHDLDIERERINAKFKFDFQIRIGINTGSVIVGAMGSLQHIEYTVIGDTVNLANNLLVAANPGQILTSFSTYQRTLPTFDFETHHTEILGDGKPIQAYLPISLRFRPGQVRGLPGLRVPMVGRIEDFSLMQTVRDSVFTSNQSHIILVSGAAGLGKSRLVAEFANDSQKNHIKGYWGTCAAYMRITPYRVVADIIRNILGISELDSIRHQVDILSKYLLEVGLDQQDIMPNLLHVMGLLHSDPVTEARLGLLEPLMLQRETQLALRTFFSAVAKLGSSIFIFDDLHWVDQASQQFLEYYCQVVGGTPLILVLISRDFDKNGPARLIYESAQNHASPPTHIQLEPLSIQDSRLLIDQFIPEKTENAIILKNAIIQRAAGNPYYTEELVRILMDYGGLEFKEDIWKITSKATDLLDEVPGTLQDIILARFDRLPVHLRQTAQRASVLGDSFAIRLLEVIFSGSKEELNANLSELEARNFLFRSRLGSEDGFTFKHPLLQETIYKTLLRRDLRSLHYEVAQAIESGEHWLPAERNQVLALHYTESHTPTKAIPFLLISAENASQHFANDTVIQLYRQALALMEANSESNVDQVQNATIKLGQALKFAGQFDEAVQIFKDLIEKESAAESMDSGYSPPSPILVESIRELGDLRAREGDLDEAVSLLTRGMQVLGEEARIENPIAWRQMIDRLAWVFFRQGKLEEAHNWADLALMELKSGESDDPITQASLYNTIGGIYWTRSRFQDAISSVERSLSIYQDLGYQWGVSVALTNLGVLNYSIGKWQNCIDYLERADQIRNDFGNHPERPINLINLSEALISMGDYDRAWEKLRISLEISKRLGSQIYLAYSELKLTHLAILEEKVDEAKAHIEKARSFLEPLDEVSERTVQYFMFDAQLKMLNGNYADALTATTSALEIAEKGGFQEKKIEVLQTIGQIHINMANLELAEEYLKESISLKGSQFNEALGLLELGNLYIQRAKQNPHEEWVWYQQAENHLDRVIGTLSILGAQRYLQRAQNLHAIIPTRTDTLSKKVSSILVAEENKQINSVRKRLGLPEGEWHQAAIITCELVPNQQVDEELLFETVAFLLPLLQNTIIEHEGQILRHPNGLTGIFGAPAAHEDDPVRAVETAMQIINFHTELYQQTQLPVSIRVGITMGRIVAGWPELEGTFQTQNPEFLAAGQPLQLSRTLADATSPSQVWVTQPVYHATSYRFQYEPVPIEMVDQLSDKTIFQLLGEREQILPVRGLIGLRTVFVGRQKEINALVEASNDLSDNKGRMVWVEGDPGIGKSRLTREFENHLSGSMTVLRGTCTSRRSDIAFSVFSDLISDALGIEPNFSLVQIYQQIEQQMTAWSIDLEFRPYLELLAGVQPSGQPGDQLMALEPEQLRRQTFVTLNRLFTRLAMDRQLIFILDDIQWIDGISADLLLYLSPLIFTQPIMFICIQRLNEDSEFEQVLEKIKNMTVQLLLKLQLKPLSNDECVVLLSQFLDNTTLEESLQLLIVQQSGGNPYYIEEFVRMLVEQDYLRVVRGKLEVNQSFEIDRLHIPSSLETLIRARVDALPLSARQLLQVASVIGHQFSPDLLTSISARGDVQVQLNNLDNRGMLNFSPDTNLWEFGHPMIEIIVYNTVLKAQRRILHSRTAEALEAQWQGQEIEHADELAYHYSRAENHPKTLHYLMLAGERAANRYANDAAMGYFEQAYDLMSAVPNISELDHWRIITGLGTVYQFTGKFEASLATLQSGLDILKDSSLTSDQLAGLYRIFADTYYNKGDLDLAINYQQIALSFVEPYINSTEQAEAARLYARLGWSYFRKANFDDAQTAVLKAEELAGQTNNLPALATAENLLGGINWSLGLVDKAMMHTRQAMLHYQELGYTWGEAVALNNLAILEANSGNWNAAANFFQRALNLRIEMGDVEGIALTHNNLANLSLDQGNLEEAEASYRASLAVSEPLQIKLHRAISYTNLAHTLLALGRVKEAVRNLNVAVQVAKEVDARETLAELKHIDAQIHLVVKEFDVAEEKGRTAIQAAAEINNSQHEATSRRVVSEALLMQGRPSEALAIMLENWENLSSSIADLDMGRMNAQFYRVHSAMGEKTKASRYYETALQIFKRLGAEYDLKHLVEQSPFVNV